MTSPSEDIEGAVPTNLTKQLSTISAKYDVGNKGYLDETEKVMRQYDTNNDGNLDNDELKKIVMDLQSNKYEKAIFKKAAWFAGAAVVALLLGNFGLVWATLALTRQVETQQGALVDSSTGKQISTKANGNHIAASVNPEYARRLMMLHGRRLIADSTFDFHEEVRRLNEEVPVAALPESAEVLEQQFHEYEDGTDAVISVTAEGTTYTGTVGSGATFTPRLSEDGCDIYDQIKEVETTEPVYKIECCGSDTCQAYQLTSGTTSRRLQDDSCFSPMSMVVEKNKGRVFIKDLKAGDLVLASNGVYQKFLFSAHSHPSKPTDFVQIHTESSVDAPLEATPDHLVFVVGNDLPIPAGKVKIGDAMVGVNGPKTVTNIAMVTREGFHNALTSDATLFVDGVLASSTIADDNMEGEDHVLVNIGPVKFHIHTISNRVIAPLIDAGCSNINSFFCDTQVDDGSGGSMNVLIHFANVILTMHPVLSAIIFALYIAVAFMSILAYYYLALALVPISILLGIANLFKYFKPSKKKVL